MHLQLPLQQVNGGLAGGHLECRVHEKLCHVLPLVLQYHLCLQLPGVVRVGGGVVQYLLVAGDGQLGEPHLSCVMHYNITMHVACIDIIGHLVLPDRSEDLVVELCPAEHGHDGRSHLAHLC